MNKQYSGYISTNNHVEYDDALYVSCCDYPLAEELSSFISGKQVTARYWITEKEIDKEKVKEEYLKQIFGIGEAEFEHRYSELTGYLWTDEELNIGGHDLLEELKTHTGKYLILEIEIHE